MIWYFTPWANDKNAWGRTLNMYMEMVPHEEDWACFRDGDTMFLNQNWGNIVQAYVDKYPDTGLFTCYASRVGKHHGQRYRGIVSNDPNIINHKRLALKIWAENGVGGDPSRPVLSSGILSDWVTGVLYVIKKKSWRVHPFPEEGNQILNVDKIYSRSVLANGEKIRIMQGLYIFHLYRLGDPGNSHKHLL